MLNSTIKAKQPIKANLHAVLYYNPAFQSPPKKQVSNRASCDEFGKLKKLKIVLIGNPKYVVQQFEEILTVEEGIHVGKIKGYYFVYQVQVFYSTLEKSQEKVIEYSLKIQGSKIGVIVTELCQKRQCISYIKSNMKLWRSKYTESPSLLLYSFKPSEPSNKTLPILEQILDRTIRQNCFFTNIPLIDDTMNALKSICAFQAVQEGCNLAYQKEREKFANFIKEGKVQIVEIGKIMGTFVEKIKEIWGEKIQEILTISGELMKLFNLSLEILEEQPEYRNEKIQVIRNTSKLSQTQIIQKYLEDSLSEQKRQRQQNWNHQDSFLITNKKQPSTKLEIQSQRLLKIIEKIQENIEKLKAKQRGRLGKKQENLGKIKSNIQCILAKIKDAQEFHKDFLCENQQNNMRDSLSKSMDKSIYQESDQGNYQKSDQQVKQQEYLKARMVKNLENAKNLQCFIMNTWNIIKKEFHSSQLMLVMQQENLKRQMDCKREESNEDAFTILAHYFVKQRLRQQQQKKQIFIKQNKQKSVRKQEKIQTNAQRQNIRDSMYDALLSNSTFPEQHNQLANKQLNNFQKARESLVKATQLIYNFRAQQLIQNLKAKQYVEYKLHVYSHNLSLLQKFWMKPEKKMEQKDLQIMLKKKKSKVFQF